MGDSQPPAAAIDLVGSYARLRDEQVELVLNEPADSARSATRLVLANGSRRVRAAAEFRDEGAGRLVCRAPRAELADGIWSLTLEDSAGSENSGAGRVAARLLVQGDRPLVLLWGARTAPSYVPRSPTAAAPASPPSATAKQQRAARAGHALDLALSPLPDKYARRVRASARRAARRILS